MFVGGCLIGGWVVRHVIYIGLVLGVRNIFIVGVLVGHNGIGGKMLGFIGSDCE